MKLKVVNLFGGPGAGKSTCAYGLLHAMRCRGMNVEFAPEFAKDLVFDGELLRLSDQREVFKEQRRRIERYAGRVEWVVTDSPLLLGLVYKDAASCGEDFDAETLAAHYSFMNWNCFLRRTLPYVETGRLQREAEAEKLSTRILDMLRERFIPFESFDGDASAPARILASLGEAS